MPNLPGRLDPLAGPSVGDVAEAFLAGRARRVIEAAGHPVPPWAWFNLLARGSLEEIAACAIAQPSSPSRPGEAWYAVQAHFAADLVRIAGDPATLQMVQKSVLQPLEGRLIDVPALRDIPVEQFVRIAQSALAVAGDHLRGPGSPFDRA